MVDLPPNLADYLRENIKKQNYAPLPFPLSYKELCDAQSCFFEFLTLPFEAKQQFFLYINPNDPESMVGYVKREQGMEGHLDEKEYFHYNRYAEEAFTDLSKTIGTKASDFLKSARYIYSSAELLTGRILKSLNEEYPGIYDAFFSATMYPYFYLRFLKYNVRGEGNFLAGGHYDNGGCTLALAESAPGLRIGLNEATLREVEHKDNHAIFMPGIQFHMFTSEDFPPSWHDVVQKSEDTFNDEVARWSIVFFVDPANKKETTWEERHKPLH